MHPPLYSWMRLTPLDHQDWKEAQEVGVVMSEQFSYDYENLIAHTAVHAVMVLHAATVLWVLSHMKSTVYMYVIDRYACKVSEVIHYWVGTFTCQGRLLLPNVEALYNESFTSQKLLACNNVSGEH